MISANSFATRPISFLPIKSESILNFFKAFAVPTPKQAIFFLPNSGRFINEKNWLTAFGEVKKTHL